MKKHKKNIDEKINLILLSKIGKVTKPNKISLNGKSSPVIDGLTGEQRFFFGSAQADRVKFRKEIDAMRVATDPHSPSRYRIDGVFVNMPSFHEAFETQEGDKMFRNKDEIIKIW